jgi:PAS domain S-box-containing protein
MDTLFLMICGGSLAVGAVTTALYFLRRERLVREEVKLASQAAVDAAHASETRWQLLFEQSPLSVQIFRPDGQTKRVNAAWRHLFHLTEEHGLAFNVLTDPDLNASGAVNLIRLAFEGQAVNVPPVPFPVNTDPPQIRWIGGVLYPVKDQAGRVMEVVTVHHDITETKRAEEAMQALNQTLEERVVERTGELEEARAELHRALEAERELGEMKSRFVGMVSHEFRTPLGVTMSAVEVIRHYDEKLTADKRRELCDDIYSATRSMASLMEHILLLGRVEAGKMGCRPAALDFAGLLQKIVDEQHSITERRCPIEMQLADDIEGAVGDEALLRHIFGNLVSNAVKYSPAGESVLVSVNRRGSEAVCSIVDRGIGIPEKDQERLFESFSRASNVGDIPGTGLGLVIVKRCVEYHGGSITLTSAPGEGTTFTVVLPVFQAEAEAVLSA